MAEQVNPGVDPPRRGSLGDPARKMGGQDQALQAAMRRIQTLERFLQPYREKLVQVRRDDGTFQTISVLAKEGGGEGSGGYGSTIVPKTIFKKDGAWRLVFYPAVLIENSLLGAADSHEIKTPDGGKLTDDPPPEIPLSGETQKVWLKYIVTSGSSIDGESPEITVGEEPERNPMEPVRPESEGKDGNHAQLVGTVQFTDGAPEWIPANSDATVSVYLPIIECVGDGEKDYDSYIADPPTDRWRTFRGENAKEIEEDEEEKKTQEEFADPNETGMELRKFPVRINVRVKDNTLVFSGFVNVPVPFGEPGSRAWQDCEGNEVMGLEWRRGLVKSTGNESMEAGCDGNDGYNSL